MPLKNFFEKLFKRFMERKPKLQHPILVNAESSKITFVAEIMKWVDSNKNDDAILLLDGSAVSCLKVYAINFDYNSASLVSVWDTCIVIGSSYTLDGKPYVALNEFIVTYPRHEVVYKTTPSLDSKVYILQLEDATQE